MERTRQILQVSVSPRSQNQLAKGTIQFGVFELNLDTGELRRNGIRVKLQGKAFHILQALLERPGEVVMREELQTRLWPGDTFVDFESGLNTAANRLRLTLGDSAENPRFIETIARTGYRFIGTVTVPMPPPSPALLPVEVPRSRIATLTPYRLRWLLAGALAGAIVSMVVWASRQAPVPPSFRQVTFRRGVLNSARFGPDGETILYSAEWDGASKQLFLANTVSPESRALDFQKAGLASVSLSSELALLSMDSSKSQRGRTLSRVPLNGGAPLTIATGVAGADWGPDGKSLAVFRIDNRESVVEYPVGKVLYRTAGAISDLRVSPRGDSVAFLEHPVRADDAGLVKLVTRSGIATDLSPHWASAGGLAWSPSGTEIWFAAGETGVRRAIYRVTLDGKVRHVASLPGTLTLYDISKTGSVLLGIDRSRLVLAASSGNGSTERDISWFDWSHVVELSADGKLLLFDETGDGGGANHSVYLRNLATDSTVRLGDGQALGWSPHLNWVLALNAKKPTYLSLLPIGPEAPRTLFGSGLKYNWARFFPDGQCLLVAGNFPGKPLRLFVQPVNGGEPAPLNPDVYLEAAAISPDGKQIAGVGQDRKTVILPASGGEPRALPTPFSAVPVRWSADGKALFVRQRDNWTSIRIFRCDLATTQCRMWKELTPSDQVGMAGILDVVISADERLFAYSYMKVLSELFVVNGWT
jgi:DNA-binding winged helix-turn-helix (wHTH) protein/Tol biopolymer transport system component